PSSKGWGTMKFMVSRSQKMRFNLLTIEFGAKKAVIDVFDADGVVHPVDLIAERISSYQSVVTDTRFPPAETMYRLIDTAYAENRESINAYIGEDELGPIA
ncbi:hypothetical protein, partial [Erwinia persicina]|uniref:hypothetical protein n=1 Tax=Erwinia persicina TaxID=55211 RepID=UPI001A7E4D02